MIPPKHPIPAAQQPGVGFLDEHDAARPEEPAALGDRPLPRLDVMQDAEDDHKVGARVGKRRDPGRVGYEEPCVRQTTPLGNGNLLRHDVEPDVGSGSERRDERGAVTGAAADLDHVFAAAVR